MYNISVDSLKHAMFNDQNVQAWPVNAPPTNQLHHPTILADDDISEQVQPLIGVATQALENHLINTQPRPTNWTVLCQLGTMSIKQQVLHHFHPHQSQYLSIDFDGFLPADFPYLLNDQVSQNLTTVQNQIDVCVGTVNANQAVEQLLPQGFQFVRFKPVVDLNQIWQNVST